MSLMRAVAALAQRQAQWLASQATGPSVRALAALPVCLEKAQQHSTSWMQARGFASPPAASGGSGGAGEQRPAAKEQVAQAGPTAAEADEAAQPDKSPAASAAAAADEQQQTQAAQAKPGEDAAAAGASAAEEQHSPQLQKFIDGLKALKGATAAPGQGWCYERQRPWLESGSLTGS